MDRRTFLARSGAKVLGGVGLALAGCRPLPTAQVMKEGQADKVGTTAAGAETFKPIIDEAVGKMLARQTPVIQPTSAPQTLPPAKRICFVGLENKSSEELGDFKDQIVAIIDEKVTNSKVFQTVSRRFVEAGLRHTHLRPDELFVPANYRNFATFMEQEGQPIGYLLFAELNSGSTPANGSTQRNYTLTLDLINIANGSTDKEIAEVRKVYSRSRF